MTAIARLLDDTTRTRVLRLLPLVERQRIEECDRKHRYAGDRMDAAEAEAARLSVLTGISFHVYDCPHCSGYHVGRWGRHGGPSRPSLPSVERRKERP